MRRYVTPRIVPVILQRRIVKKSLTIMAASVLVSTLMFLVLASPGEARCGRFHHGCATAAEQATVKKEIIRVFGSGYVGQTMIRCARRESGFNRFASNFRDANGGSYGVFQINGIHYKPGRWTFTQWRWSQYDLKRNVLSALRLYRDSGFGPWGGGC